MATNFSNSIKSEQKIVSDDLNNKVTITKKNDLEEKRERLLKILHTTILISVIIFSDSNSV